MLTRALIHVTVLHPNAVLAAGLRAILGEQAGFVVRQGDPSAGATPGDAPDGVVVTDHRTALDLLAAGDGTARVLALAGASRGWQVRHALERGVHGVVSGDCAPEELVQAVRRVHGGERYLCAQASRCVAESFAQPSLTPRELDVLRRVGEGLDNKTISRRLGIALGTTKAHVRTLLDKLDASTRTEAVNEALRRGLIGDA